MATIKDIAKKLGISVSAVSKGLNGANDISEELRQLVLDTAVEMGYSTKRSRKEEHRKLVIFVQSVGYEEESNFGYDIVLGFRQAAFKNKWAVDVVTMTSELQREQTYDVFMLKNAYSGALVLGLNMDDPWFADFQNTKIPAVLFDAHIQRNTSIAYIGTDNYEGIDMAVEHLSNLGHKKIAFLNGTKTSLAAVQRYESFKDSVKMRGLEFDEDLVDNVDFYEGLVEEPAKRLLANRPTAMICGNDIIASKIVDYCRNNNIRIPEDLSVIGFDNVPVAETLKITSVNQNRLELGKSGFVTLSALLQHIPFSRTLMRPDLIIRESTTSI